jgi:hypothetical protein
MGERMEPVAILMPVAVVALAGFAYAMSRWRQRHHDDYLAMVGASNRAFESAAASLGLTYAPGPVHRHPLLGAIPEFGTAEGVHGGFRLQLRVAHESELTTPVVYRTHLVVRAADARAAFAPGRDEGALAPVGRLVVEAGSITLAAAAPCRKPSMSYQFFLVLDPDELRALAVALLRLAERLRSNPPR